MEVSLAVPSKAKKVDNWYELAFTGKFIHPITRKEHNLNEGKFSAWISYFDYMKSKGNTIPVVPNHSMNPTDRLGTLSALKIENGSIWGQIEYNEGVAEKVKDSSFSVRFNDEWTEFDGTGFESILVHVGVTDYPVLKGLHKSVAASSVYCESDLAEVGIINIESKEDSQQKLDDSKNLDIKGELSMKSVLTELGLPETTDEATLLAAVKSLKETQKPTDDPTKPLIDKIIGMRKAEIAKLSIADDKKKELEKFCVPEHVNSELFEVTLSLVSTGVDTSKKEEEEGFSTGSQNSSDNKDSTSLCAVMDQLYNSK